MVDASNPSNTFYYCPMGMSTATNWFWCTKTYRQRLAGMGLTSSTAYIYGDPTDPTAPPPNYVTYSGTLNGSNEVAIGDLPGARVGRYYGVSTGLGVTLPGAINISSTSVSGSSSSACDFDLSAILSFSPGGIFLDPNNPTKVWVQVSIDHQLSDSQAAFRFLLDNQSSANPFFGTINIHVVSPFETISFPAYVYAYQANGPADPPTETNTGSASGGLYIEQLTTY